MYDDLTSVLRRALCLGIGIASILMAFWDGLKLSNSYCDVGGSIFCYIAELISLSGIPLNLSLAIVWLVMGIGLLWLGLVAKRDNS